MTDFSQNHIQKQLASYLQQHNRDPQLIKELIDGGFCRGFTTLNLYAKWLETQPIRYNEKNVLIHRDDFTWLKHALTVISTWDQKKPLTQDERDCFEHVLAKVNAYQNLPTIFNLAQTDFYLSFADTRNRICTLEYDLAARFNRDELVNCLIELIPEKRLIFISSHNHAMGIFKQRDTISFIDPNNKNGMIDIPLTFSDKLASIFATPTSEQSLRLNALRNLILSTATLFFEGSRFIADKPSPMTIQICNIMEINSVSSQQTLRYPPREYFLDKSSIIKMPYKNDSNIYADNYTELHEAVSIGNMEIVNYILNHPIAKDINYIEQKSSKGDTALLKAILNKRVDIIAVLLNSGANPNIENDDGGTPLIYAVQCNHLEIATLLIKAGAKINQLTEKSMTSPLMHAASDNTTSMVDLLLNENADIDLATPIGMTALANAMKKNHIDMARYLMKRGAICTGCELKFAIQNNHNELVNEFIAHGANTHKALMLAASDSDQAAINKLISLGAKLSEAYMFAIEFGRISSIRCLMLHDEIKSFTTERGIDSLLLFAAKCKQPYVFMELLLPKDAPKEGWKAWLITAKNQDIDIVAFGSAIVQLYVDDLILEREENISLRWLLFSFASHDKKLMAAKALVDHLNNLDDPSAENCLNIHKEVLSSSLNNVYKMYQAIVEIEKQDLNNSLIIKKLVT